MAPQAASTQTGDQEAAKNAAQARAALDAMVPAPASRLTGTVATYTVDRLAYSPAPPVVDIVVDFDGGGRYTLEAADADADAFDVGARVGLTFRRMFTAGGVANYFWKARLLAAQEES